jgi:hypothetical protein
MAAGGGGAKLALKGAVLGMGNPLLDISSTVPVSFLDKCVRIRTRGARGARAGVRVRGGA